MEEADDSLFSEVGNFIAQNDKLHDVYFLVGDEKERIGAVKLLLINQSRVWWSMLSPDSPLVETADIHLPDIEPATFKLLLKHCYAGLDDLQDLSEDTVLQLCYCANKYMMASLAKKIEARLQPTDIDQLFVPLHCLTKYNLHGVREAVTKIVQTQTKQILMHSEFMECDTESIVFIAKQDKLSCKELELWQAIVSWAKHKADSVDKTKLRQIMSEPLKHIRLLSLSDTELREVLADGILSDTEVANVCGKDLDGLGGFCTDFISRNPYIHDITYKVIQKKSIYPQYYNNNNYSICCIIVKNKNIFLQSLTFRNDYYLRIFKGVESCLFNKTTITVDITLTISRITNFFNNTSNEDPVVMNFSDFKFRPFDEFDISTISNDTGVLLKAYKKYSIELVFSGKYSDNMCSWAEPNCVTGHDFVHGIFHSSLMYHRSNNKGTTPCHILQFNYSVVED